MIRSAAISARVLVAAFGAAAASGCVSLPVAGKPEPLPDPAALVVAASKKGASGGVFASDNIPDLVADKRALRAGEILTDLERGALSRSTQ
jgi:hypothetical protein